MAGYNKSEQKGYNWLKKTEHTNIFKTNDTPDFTTKQGKYEIKRAYKCTEGMIKILFTEGQKNKIYKHRAKTLVFDDDNDNPIAIIDPDDIQKDIVKNIILYDVGNNQPTYFLRCRILKEYKDKMDKLVKNKTFPYTGFIVSKALKDFLDKYYEDEIP